jgi:hypothetical protein
MFSLTYVTTNNEALYSIYCGDAEISYMESEAKTAKRLFGYGLSQFQVNHLFSTAECCDEYVA